MIRSSLLYTPVIATRYHHHRPDHMSSKSPVVVYRSRTKRAGKKARTGQGVQHVGLEDEQKMIIERMVMERESLL